MTIGSTTVAQIVARLRGAGLHPPGELMSPEGGGIYAWWARRERLGDANPIIPIVSHPVALGWSLLYVGLVPREGKLETKRGFSDRVGKDHSSGNIGGSTFRQSLGALLIGHLALRPRPGLDRPRFLDEEMLTRWIEANCAVTFASCSQPWIFEEAVIAEMRAPLNLKPAGHEFSHAVESARGALRRACGP